MPWSGAKGAGFSSAKAPWLPIAPSHRERAVSIQAKDASSALARVRQFLHWRKSQPALITGAIEFIDAPEPILAFWRALGTERLLCVFNLGAKPARFTLPAGATPPGLEAIG